MNLLDEQRGFRAAVMMRFRAAHLLPAASLALVGLLASSAAVAQGSSVVTGKIIDASSSKPLVDAVVTLASPALHGERIVVTDGSGSYRIPNLPPGEYTLRIDKDNYKTYGRGGITIRSAGTFQVNAQLLPGNVTSEVIEILPLAPVVDVLSSSTGISMNQDFTNHLPLSGTTASRSFESLATVAPGAQTDAFGVSVNGTTSLENAFRVDGVGVNNPAKGTLGTPLTVEFVKELNVVSGGYMPEYGRAMGALFDVVTQSGGDEFHGSVFFNISPGALEGPRSQVLRDGAVINTNPSLSSLRDVGATVGGPILKDRLWFFGGVQAAFSRDILTRTLNALKLDPTTGDPLVDPKTGFTKVTEIPGATKQYYADLRTIQYMGKLTYRFNQDHNIVLSVFGTPSTGGGNGTFDFNNEPTNIYGPYNNVYATHQIENANDLSLKYSGMFNHRRAGIDLTLGWHHQRSATLPNDNSAIGSKDGLAGKLGIIYRRNTKLSGAGGPANHNINEPVFSKYENIPAGVCDNQTINLPDTGMACTKDAGCGSKNCIANPNGVGKVCGPKIVTPCPVTRYDLGGPGYLEDQALDSYQGTLVGTSLFTLFGHHIIKAGIEFQFATYKHVKAYSGGDFLRESTSGTNYADYRQYGFLTAPDTVQIMPKSTAATSSTTIGGFVQDTWLITDQVTLGFGARYDAQIINGADGTTGLALPNQWSPRVGIIYDFTRISRSRIFATYARYYEGVPLDISDRSFPGQVQASSFHRAATPAHPERCDPAVDPKSMACKDDAQRLVVGTTNNPNQIWTRTGGDKVPVDPNISAQSSDEITVGGEYEVFPDAHVGITYMRRWLNRAIEDMSRDEANTYFIGNPGYGIAHDFPKAQRNYDAVTLYFQKTFSSTWLAQASYTISSLRGNYAGLFRPETLQIDPNINSDFDLRSLLPNRTGPLPGDYTHQIKLYGAKDFLLPADMVLLVGLTFRTHSGAPVSYLGSHVLYGPGEVFILPRGAGGRGDWIHAFDARLGYSIKLGKQSSVGFTVDVFNLFNFQGALTRDQSYTFSDVLPIKGGTTSDLPNPKTGSAGKLTKTDGTPFDPKTEINSNFNNPTQYQDPRQFRFGAKVTF